MMLTDTDSTYADTNISVMTDIIQYYWPNDEYRQDSSKNCLIGATVIFTIDKSAPG